MPHLIAVIALALLLVIGACSAPQAGRAPMQASGSATVRVMSFNIRYGSADDGPDRWALRRDLVMDTIRRFDPDLLAIQECLAGQAEFLRERMPDFDFVGIGREDGRAQGEMAAILFRHDRFERVDHGHFWLSETPQIPGSVGWDASHTRICTWVKLRDRRSAGWECVCFNTHFDHAGATARRESAKLLRQKMRDIAGDASVIVTGDFNAPADPDVDGPFALLTARFAGGPLTDTHRVIHAGPTEHEGTFNAFRGIERGPRIDWILVDDGFEVIDAGIDRSNNEGRYPSDHFPVTAVLRWSFQEGGASDAR
jgi:endonuclease/exonuclease/phosphatase family metal-dependent hydrolase